MPQPADGALQRGGRWFGLGIVALGTVIALSLSAPGLAAPLIVGAGLIAALAAGRVTHLLGAPALFGYLAAGTLLGPAFTRLVQAMGLPWLFPHGLLGPQWEITAQPLAEAATAVAMLWVGRRVGTRAPSRELGALVALATGHIISGLALSALLAWFLWWHLGATETLRAWIGQAGVIALGIVGTSSMLTGAVVHDERGQGPVSRTMLRLSLVGEATGLVAFLVLTMLTTSELHEVLPGFPTAATLGLAVLLGGLTGLALSAIARSAPSARGGLESLFIVVAGLVTSGAGLPIALVAAIAGLVSGLSTPVDGDDALDGLAGPAFAIVFTVAGARMPLLELLPVWPLAIALVLLRAGVVLGTTAIAARLIGGSPTLLRWAWAGLLASTVPVAGVVTWSVPTVTVDPLDGAAVWIWAMAMLNGMLGALVVQIAVRSTHESPAWDVPEPHPDLESWPEGVGLEPQLADQIRDLATDLAGLTRSLRGGALREVEDLALEHLDALRRELRRLHHRTASLLAKDSEDPQDGLRLALVDFAERWRSHVLDHAARLGRPGWDPTDIVTVLGRLASSSPEFVEAGRIKPLTASADMAAALSAWISGHPGARQVPLRDVLTYRLGGQTPGALEGVVARLVSLELDLAALTREIFLRSLDAYGDVARQDRQEARAMLERVATDLSADVEAGRKAVVAGLDEAASRTDAVFRGALRDIEDDLALAGSFDLPARMRGADRVELERRRGMKRLTVALPAARDLSQARFNALALEVELLALALQVRRALSHHGAQLARLVRGRGTRQLERILEATVHMVHILEQADKACTEPSTGAEAAALLRGKAEEVSRVAQDAISTTREARDQLTTPEAISPLLAALTTAANGLTQSYRIPTERVVSGSWALPEPAETADVSFREIVLTYLETSVTHDLMALTQRTAQHLTRLVSGMEAVERAVGFNAELAAAEVLMAAEEGTPTSRDSISRVLTEALERARTDLEELGLEATEAFAHLETDVQDAVLTDLDQLRVDLADGELARVQAALATTRPLLPRGLAAQPSELVRRAREALARWLPAERLRSLRRQIGLAEEAPAEVLPVHFTAPAPSTKVPVVYRRLFSEHALDAGELLAGRQERAARVREALATHNASLRAVAVTGPSGAGQHAVVSAALRALRTRGVHRLELTEPVDEAEVDTWFEGARSGHVYVISGFSSLFTLRPGGFAPLRHLVDRVIADDGANAWVIEADDASWSYASDFAPLERAFPTEVRLDPLDAAGLQAAVLARHEMSGFRLGFTGLDEDADETRRERFQTRWFQRLHAAACGLARDAMLLWLSSLVEVDVRQHRVLVGEVPAIPTEAMRRITARTAMTLRAAARQGWVEPASTAELFAIPTTEAAARLSHLAHWGLLIREGDRYRLPHHLRYPLSKILAERGWT